MAAALGGTVRVSVLALQPRRDLGACQRLARGLQQLLRDRGGDTPVDVQVAPADPVEAVRALGAFDVVVGVRLHALILAGAAGVPFVGLAYDPKVTALLAEVGWPVAAVEPRDAADAGAWRQRLEAVAADHAGLRSRLESMRRDLASRVLDGLAPLARLERVEPEPLPRAGSPPAPVEVLGVGVHPVSLSEGEAIAAAWLAERGDDSAPVRQVVTLNPEIVMQARCDPALAGIVRQADLVVPDGIGVVWAGRMLGHPMKGRVPGIELAERLLALCAARGLAVFLVGGRPEGPHGRSVAEEAARRLQMRPEMTGLVVAGVHHGYFAPGSAEEAALLERLERTGPALLLVGMGSPRQEAFIARHRERLRGRVRVAVGVGGSLDVWAGRARRAPPLVRRLALEWLYRTALDVRRLGRLAALPGFVAAVLAERMGGIMGQRGHRRA
ncbi:WecB/TagA/CpsF family glycosyltransferase [Geochorda subterranea]|uniref:WecB/TagA/CpsF family glycosyltransferase n=1 Tax=Geochorda subterranea TaxID=3109564 RepID=A0ABZ1BT18_9FIRM|nr:WecB/TagA/CpsF family glycosyltransferase [Limnochorda sp. LNt]WRP15972.1 WecB/TagA/CpsF family glycosyltransferase [Limnochorda sp. LNt]